MKTKWLIIVVLLEGVSQLSSSFCILPNNKIHTYRLQKVLRNQHDDSKSKGNNSNSLRSNPKTEDSASATSWIDQLDESVLSVMKQELVSKYQEQGMDEDVARIEVDAFFRDKDQAEKYVEMRMYTAAVTEDVGPATIIQLVGGFLLGFLAIVGPKLWNSGVASGSF